MSKANHITAVLGYLPLAASVLLSGVTASVAAEAICRVGVARVDITPDYAIRLAGYGGRRTESEGVVQRLWAKALAIESDEAGPAVLIMVDNCGVPASATEAVAERLKNKARIPRERFVLCSTHIHTGPCLKGVLPTMFAQPIPEAHQALIDRYTRELTDRLEQVALAALADRRPAQLAWAKGKVAFAVNRRVMRNGKCLGLGVTPEGPVDHDLPLLRVRSPDGRLRAVVVNYACHCTALGGDFNRICGDWAGYAQEYIERDHDGAICLVTIGCGADANPEPRTGLVYAKQQGRQIANEVNRLLKQDHQPIQGALTCRLERIKLPFEKSPTREEWQQRAKRGDFIGYHAGVQLARLDRGEALQTELSYPVQTWVFGKTLAMVFLAGEVVVDYSLRLKKEFDARRLWVTVYANDLPCYIPSRRILAEGGYEADTSMMYYDRPGRLAPEVENLVVAAVHRLLPRAFCSDQTGSGAP